MDIREKLVEIIQKSVGGCARNWAEVIADGLIANGVTMQEWQPVTKETKPKCPCLVIDIHGNRQRIANEMLHYTHDEYGYFCCDRDIEVMATDLYTKRKIGIENLWRVAYGNRIAYWMPLPQPPKGE